MLIGLIIPAAEVQIYIGGLKFTIARLAIFLLLFPALSILLKRGRHLLTCDFFVLGLAIWILSAAIYTDGTASLSSAGAESVEFFGGYLVARAFFFGAPAIRAFIEVLKILFIAVVIIAMMDAATGRLVVHETLGSIFGVAPIDAQYRMGVVRATATFDHAILLGAFCAFVGAILLFAETNVVKRIMFVGVCLFCGILSLSSSGLMAFTISFATYAYDKVLKQFSWRWLLLWSAIGAGLLLIIAVTNKPLGWVLSNLTLDPDSGYFRLSDLGCFIGQDFGSSLDGARVC